MIGILLAGALTALIYYTCVKPMSYWKDLGVKQTNPWPLLGDSWMNMFRRLSVSEFIQWVYNLHPNSRYSGSYQFTRPMLIIKDTELIKEIAVKGFDHFTDRRGFTDSVADPLFGGNLANLKGHPWREMRVTLSGSFTSSKMKTMFHLIEEAAENFVQYFLDKNEDIKEIELKDAFSRYTNDVIATTAFGIKCDSLAQPNNEFYLAGKKMTNFGTIRRSFILFGYMLMPKLFQLLKIQIIEQDIATFFKNTINEAIKAREEKGIVRPDMLNLLLEAKKGIKYNETETIETGFATVKESADIGKFKQLKKLTNDDIISQALVFFGAGFDTISTGLCFGSYELALQRDIQNKLREEIKETYKKCNGKVTYDVLLKMNYLDMVISEILRKWPPAPVVDRVCTKPYTIEPVTPDEKSVPLKVGSLVALPVYSIHRDPTHYPNPDKFDPERFSDENKDNIKPYTYMPFGVGPRNCIGSRFALLEMKAMLFNLLLNFEIVPCKKTQIPLKLDRSTSVQNTAEGGFWFGLKRVKG